MRSRQRSGAGHGRARFRRRAEIAPPALHAEESRVPPAAMPLVWLLALLWLALQSFGRGLGQLHDGYERAAAAAGRACLRVAQEILRLLGPLGRAVRPLLTLSLRGLLHVWNSIGVHVLLLARPLGKIADVLLLRARPILDLVLQWMRRVALRVEPVLRALDAGARRVERAVGHVAEQLRRLAQPVARAVRAFRSVLAARRST